MRRTPQPRCRTQPPAPLARTALTDDMSKLTHEEKSEAQHEAAWRRTAARATASGGQSLRALVRCLSIQVPMSTPESPPYPALPQSVYDWSRSRRARSTRAEARHELAQCACRCTLTVQHVMQDHLPAAVPTASVRDWPASGLHATHLSCCTSVTLLSRRTPCFSSSARPPSAFVASSTELVELQIPEQPIAKMLVVGSTTSP